MANVKWIKITVDMFDDEKIKLVQSMPEGDSLLIIWIKLITLAGKTNDGGYVYIADNIPYTDEMLSVIMNKPLNVIRLALNTFTKLGMIESDTKGIYLLNFEKHQSLDRLAEIKEQTRKRVAKHREKQKLLASGNECNVTDTLRNDTDIDKELDKDTEKDKEIIKEKKYFENDNLNSIFIEFLNVRKKLKAVNSDRAINTLINKLNKYDDTIKYEMIEKSIVNSWKDVYELKENNIKPYASNTSKRVEIVPDWIDKPTGTTEMTPEEKEAFERELAELQKTLKENY